ncbi:MAG TPA: AI-2E family transporter [Miltoncostaeaceae bacterium]|nr:AI-2E family transporter [Miltoncostaeaceae bacterium]
MSARRLRLPGRRGGEGEPAPEVARPPDLEPGDLVAMFGSPRWLRDLGRSAWLLVGLALVLAGLVWILGITATIVEPVMVAGVLAAVASPAVAWLQRRHGLPRAAGAGLVLLGLLVVGVLLTLLVIGGIIAQGDQITAALNKAAGTISGWAQDAGVGQSGAQSATDDVTTAVPDIGSTLLNGVAQGISGLTSLAFFLSFAIFSTFFLLKDGPVFRRFIDRHLGIPRPVASVVTGRVITSLQRYFLGVTIVAGFNATVVGLAAWILGVPLAGTIAVVTFVTAYVPFIGAFVAGFFAVLLALADQGTETALIMLVVVILANGALQQIVQPIAFGATLGLNPLVVLIVTIAAGSMFGMVGLVLAAPLTSAATHIAADVAAARRAGALDPADEAPAGGAPADSGARDGPAG